MKALARRISTLRSEAEAHQEHIEALVKSWRPDLLELVGVGPIVAATTLVVWSHPGRIRSESAFAMLGGVAPIPASSGMTTRHRLNRRGDRHLNCALHIIAIQRQRLGPRHQDLHRTATRRRQDRPRDPPLPQALHRPRALPNPRIRT